MTDDPRYPQLSIDVASGEADDAAALLFELGAQGVEERDETTLQKGPNAGTVTLVASFESHELAQLAAAGVDPAWSPRVSEIVGDAWRDEWKKHFVPFRLTTRVTIRPPWEPYRAESPSEIVLELEPGRAFGTGLHATTALVAKALEARSDLAGEPRDARCRNRKRHSGAGRPLSRCGSRSRDRRRSRRYRSRDRKCESQWSRPSHDGGHLVAISD